MRLLLAPEDIRTNAFVSVYSPIRHSIPELAEHPKLAALVARKTPVPAGVPLRVLECSLPFVVCAVIAPGGGEAGPIILDLREIQLCRLGPAFVNAIVSFEATEGGDEDDCPDDGMLF